jgi:hypothetical protein
LCITGRRRTRRWRSSARCSRRGRTCTRSGTTTRALGKAAGSRRCAAAGRRASGTRIGTTFFSDLAASIEIGAFKPHSFAAGEDDVHLLVDWTIRPVKTGREASMTMHH